MWLVTGWRPQTRLCAASLVCGAGGKPASVTATRHRRRKTLSLLPPVVGFAALNHEMAPSMLSSRAPAPIARSRYVHQPLSPSARICPICLCRLPPALPTSSAYAHVPRTACLSSSALDPGRAFTTARRHQTLLGKLCFAGSHSPSLTAVVRLADVFVPARALRVVHS